MQKHKGWTLKALEICHRKYGLADYIGEKRHAGSASKQTQMQNNSNNKYIELLKSIRANWLKQNGCAEWQEKTAEQIKSESAKLRQKQIESLAAKYEPELVAKVIEMAAVLNASDFGCQTRNVRRLMALQMGVNEADLVERPVVKSSNEPIINIESEQLTEGLCVNTSIFGDAIGVGFDFFGLGTVDADGDYISRETYGNGTLRIANNEQIEKLVTEANDRIVAMLETLHAKHATNS